ncbi:trans-aconitate 2-methyltransferase [Peptococcaceae bacterium CEB3]|nr:trans-aconitate 2-methyltransferase [Peptococcaceae bacterium CEB3]
MGSKKSSSDWDSNLYDDKISFVSKLGKDVVTLLDPQPGERILDLGCGTGDLTHEIHRSGAIPVGIDYSESMVKKAIQKYPNITFQVENGETFRVTEPFDAVFSNAALHWMTKPSKAAESVWLALRQGGRFVAEFGGKGNVQTISKAVYEVISSFRGNVPEPSPWYYPSVGEYASLLETQGFRVVYAVHFDRPTQLEDGENGLKHWLDMFADAFFSGLSDGKKSEAYSLIEEKLNPKLFADGNWFADYVRIRVKALRE